MRSLFLAFLIILFGMSSAVAFPPTSDEFDDIIIGGSQTYVPAPKMRDINIAHLQIVMDRLGVSPGVIDGLDTPRFREALKAFNAREGLAISASNAARIAALLEETGGEAFTTYVIARDDTRYKFTPKIPKLYVEQASMRRIDYQTIEEMLAERFHMDEDYLREINEGKEFSKIGTAIKVASFGKYLQKRVSRIEADKRKLQVRAYNSEGDIVAVYPASIGSAQTPSPVGTHIVRNKAQNPAYTYDPKGSAQPGQSDGLVLLPPGPNGPVGGAWIGLSKKTYGIHGTPDPSNIGVTQSVGCVRLTNWDALELARLVSRGAEVTFIE